MLTAFSGIFLAQLSPRAKFRAPPGPFAKAIGFYAVKWDPRL